MSGAAGPDLRAEIKQKVLAALEAQKQLIARAVEEAASATTHADARQESKYDTRAIESSYLAGAQAERLLDLTQKIQTIERTVILPHEDNQPVRATCLVCATDEDLQEAWYMVLNGAGGLKIEVGSITVTMLAPDSPLGREFLGKFAGDEVAVGRGDAERLLTIGKIL